MNHKFFAFTHSLVIFIAILALTFSALGVTPAQAAFLDWSALGATPLNDYVYAIAFSGTDVYVGGDFTDAGGDANADYIARWNGSAWSALGTTPLNGAVYAIAINGTDVYVGGWFTDAGGDTNADNIAKWDGSAWSALGATPLNGDVRSIAISGTDVYVGGDFTDAGGDANADHIAKWNGSAWSALGATPLSSGVNPIVFSIAISGTDVYVGGYFTDAGGVANADYLAKWNGSAWSALGATPLNGWVIDIAISGTDVYVGGVFTDAGGDPNADNIAKWDGSAWSALGATPLNDVVYAIAISGTDVYVGGAFSDAGGDANADYIAKWDGSAWSAPGATPLNNWVDAIAISGTDVYVGGEFTDAGGDANADYLAKLTSFHTVTFDGNGSDGGGPMSNQTASVATNLTANTFTRTGYTFAGWNTAADGGGTSYADGASYPFTADVTLYAQWAINTAPVAVANAYAASMGVTLKASTVLANDTDADGDPLTAIKVGANPAHASAFTFNSNGTFSYKAVTGYQGTDTFRYKANDGTADSNTVTVTITVRPLTRTFQSAAAYDGWVMESAENSNVGGSFIVKDYGLRVGDHNRNQQDRAFMHFNTAGLPDTAVITKATLQMKKIDTSGTDPFIWGGKLLVDIKTGSFGSAALQASDFQAAATRSNVGASNFTLNSGWYQTTLKAISRADVNRAGATQFRLRFTTDDNNNRVIDYVRFYSGNQTNFRPRLIIQYYVP